jgi:NADH dehydrogenase FAD-containing subunit
VAETYPQLQVQLVARALGEGLDDASRAVLRAELSALRVAVREGMRVASLTQDGALLEDGSCIDATISVRASGFEPVALPCTVALAHAPDGRTCVDSQLRVLAEATAQAPRRSLDGVFAVGDFAAPRPETVGSGLRSTRMGCVDAMPLGAHAADQVARLLTHTPLRPFHFDYMIQCISIGRRRGVVLFVDQDDRPTGRVIRGRVAALVKETSCRFVLGGLRLERLKAGLYAWPGQHRSGMLAERLPVTTSVSSDQV